MIDIGTCKNVLIMGYGISGKSAYEFLKRQGANLCVFDDATDLELKDRVHNVDWGSVDLVVKSPSVPFMNHNCHPIVRGAIDHNVPVVSIFDVFNFYNPEAKIIAITGTDGKSTTSALACHILKKAGISAQLGGNIGVPYFDIPKAEWYILEMSSYELASSQYLNFEIACVLNIEPDHLEFHGSLTNYIEAKHKALEHAKVRIISYEDKFTMAKYANQNNVMKISTEKVEDADVYAYEGALRERHSQQLILDLTGMPNLRGKHNHQNMEFAYAICKQLDISSREILKNMHTFTPLPHRIHIVKKVKNILFVNDSKATSPNAAAKALATFVGYKIYWLVGGRSKGIDPIPYIKPYIAEIQKIYLFGESMDEFELIFKKMKEIARCHSMSTAVNSAFIDAKKETGPAVILLSPMCASFDQFENFEHRGNEFEKIVQKIK
ncbi:MAG: UDP-N-acetylmuramoyl-L-alanine--D-glutamate ligase [Holosporales bacterium]|jgi:UDP-N-acetylmuramoylalanine--D-glutamate ligase|nr:UDP-N-acetylmuramoyl-L-alanine--D-glutamate ligase [Holosporales bacterium]